MAYSYITSQGVIVPDTNTTLTEVQNEWQLAFGADLDLTPSTPQGIMITAEVLARDGVARNNADLANQINPNLASGIFLDAICALSGLTRSVATRSTVTATVTGTPGVIIYAGAKAETTAGDQFEAISSVTIPVGGTVDVPFQSVLYGPIPALAGSLTVIVDSILGWATVTNATAATLGTAQQSDLSLWTLRKNTLALQGVQTTEAVISGLYATEGVQSLQFRENYTSAITVIDTISMAPHSIYVCVNGGTDANVASAILTHRSAGSDFNGTTTVNVTAASGQIIPVKFDRPSVINVLSRLTVRLSAGASGTVLDQIKQRVLDYANGSLQGEPGFVVGGSISPFELAGAAMGISGVYVVLSEVAPVSTGIYQTTEIPIAINQIGAITLSGITVTVV